MTVDWDRRSASEHQRIQDRLLSRWVPEAATYSEFWGEVFRQAEVDPDGIEDADALRRLPPVRELDLQGLGGPGSPALVLRPTEAQVKSRASFSTLWSIARSIRGGGTSGKRRALLREFKPLHLTTTGRHGGLAVAYTRSDLDRLHRAGARTASVLGLDEDDELVSAVPADDSLRFWGLYHLAQGSSMLAIHPRGAGSGLDQVLRGFALVPATVVAVPTAEAVELAALLTETGTDVSRLRTLLLVGQPPSSSKRRDIRDAWDAAGAGQVRVLAAWAPSGARTLWAECAASAERGEPTGLHTYPDLEVVELLEPATGTAADAGGDVTVTSVGWRGTGLLRFGSGDYAGGLTRDPCPACERTLPRVTGPFIAGAWQPQLATPAGIVTADLRGTARVLHREPAVTAWRIELQGPTGRDEGEGYVIHVAGDGIDAVLADLQQRATAATGAPPRRMLVDDRDDIEARVAGTGSVFDDRRR